MCSLRCEEAAHPPATAGGTDLLQVRLLTMKHAALLDRRQPPAIAGGTDLLQVRLLTMKHAALLDRRQPPAIAGGTDPSKCDS